MFRINLNNSPLHKINFLLTKTFLEFTPFLFCFPSGKLSLVSLNWFPISVLPIIQMGFLMKRSLPQKPIYFDRQPADHNRMTYSTPKKTTRQISIQKSVSLANSAYSSIVDKTLNIKQTSTSMNLWTNVVINFNCS